MIDPSLPENILSSKILECAIEVHRTLGGPGLLESIYEEAFCHELALCGLKFERQAHVPVFYKGVRIGSPLVLDLVIEDLVIVENKATTQFNDIYKAQLRTYLRVTGKRLGFVINFGEKLLKDGIHRVVNNL